MTHLETLNERQWRAVQATSGPILIIAGAGAGKTKTLTYRILHLIKQGVSPSAILAITFTNKAAKEMRDRVTKLLASDPSVNFPAPDLNATRYTLNASPFVSTFHSLGVHIIRENARLLGLTRHFQIFDKADSARAVKDAVVRAGLDPKSFEPARIANIISREKGDSTTPESFEERATTYIEKIVAKIWRHYESILKEEKALDFDDLLLKTVWLLSTNPSVREHYQKTWRYIHVDEYQDTNKVQYEIVRLLAEKHKNIAVVGDIDQTIYSWRGADIRNILEFEKDYPEAKVVVLEENYRSTKTILEVANRINKKNKERREKNLFTQNPTGERLGLFEAYDEADEAGFAALKSRDLIESGLNPSEIAVLYRANFQGRALEEAFLNADVPYQVLGTRFFERKEVKDVVSYLRAALNPESFGDFKRIINVPARGIGKVTLLKMFSGQENSLPSGTRDKISQFRNLLAEIKRKGETEKLSDVLKYAVKMSGLEKTLTEGSDEDLERLENIKELVTFATRYDGLPPTEAAEAFLTDAALASDQDELIKDKNAVKLMTVHASKGLEFDYVFVTGLEENLFPHKKVSGDDVSRQEAEEERRLFYVALTRARKKVFLSYASVRTIFGARQVNIPSEFIFDIDEEFLAKEESMGGVRKVIRF
jgi:DNA helicase-2/ATP-dependent DNA helicase PcrA